MISPERTAIERHIRELSLQLREAPLREQGQKFTEQYDLTLLRAMLDKWRELADYYEHNIYEKNREQDIDTDLEMSLFIVGNYLDWMFQFEVYMGTAAQKGDRTEEDELWEYHHELKGHMERILAITADKDDLQT